MKINRMGAILSKIAMSSILAVCVLGQVSAQAQQEKTKQEKVLIRTSAESNFDFDLASTKGKVVLVFHWSTNCAVCLDKMAELRSNIGGWKSKPFVVVAINHDKNRKDFQDYLRIHKSVDGVSDQFIHVFNKDLSVNNLYKNERLPSTFVLDNHQMLKHTYIGRIPANAWDDIADLLP
jgi:peroxiredoxin